MVRKKYLNKCISSMQRVIDNISCDISNEDNDVGVILSEDKCLGYINLRLAGNNNAARDIVKDILGIDLASINNRNKSDNNFILGIGPTEWIIICKEGNEKDLIKNICDGLGDNFSLVCDISGGMTKLNITGNNAQDLLEKGCYVDLHESVFKVDNLYATQIANAPVIIIKNDKNDFSLIVRRSFSEHIAGWVVDASYQYGFKFS